MIPWVWFVRASSAVGAGGRADVVAVALEEEMGGEMPEEEADKDDCEVVVAREDATEEELRALHSTIRAPQATTS